MKNVFAMVFFVAVITSTSSILSISLNRDGNDPEIFMVLDDPTSMHSAGMEMTKAEIGKFVLEDGKVLTLSRKSSLSNDCIYPEQPCGALDWCCEGLVCNGLVYGKCKPEKGCRAKGAGCALLSPCCFPNKCSSPWADKGKCR
nr:hypothetical protein [Tanacetum cinerariifolium]